MTVGSITVNSSNVTRRPSGSSKRPSPTTRSWVYWFSPVRRTVSLASSLVDLGDGGDRDRAEDQCQEDRGTCRPRTAPTAVAMLAISRPPVAIRAPRLWNSMKDWLRSMFGAKSA